MSGPEVNYRSLSERNPFDNADDTADNANDNDDTPRNSGIMIHIVPETNKALWNHIEDLDSFFTKMYNYHQKHGFTIIVLDEIFQLFEFAFVVWLLTFTIHCINYSMLFGYEKPKSESKKVTLADVITPMSEVVHKFGVFTFIILFLAILYITFRFIKMIYYITQYSDIKKFYNTALHIEDSELDNITWHEVKKKVREVQAEQHMCIDKEQLTELDIYHRILRFENYKVALMNKNLLPVRFNIPYIGEVVTLTRGLMFNIDFILFRGPGSPFQNNWQLRDDYTVRSNQTEVAQRLSKLITWMAIANFILAPVIFVWQIIYFTFAYANILRKEPGALGMRTWSNYGRLYLRHFNELDHELDARLNRAYEFADKYMSSFSSPLMAIVAKNLLFISGGILVLILTLGIYDEYVFQVEHVLTIITALSCVGLVCRTLIPDENLIWYPEQLMTAILAHVNYMPSDWKNQAHTKRVRKEFGNFFQFKAGYLLNEVFSPLITPFVLLFVFRPKAVEIVKFFRSFTVTVRGVGNVCSFAQMDIRKHGNPDWQLPTHKFAGDVGAVPILQFNDEKRRYAVENGKTELSLVRFTLTNPEWQMPQEAREFLNGIRENALQDLLKAKRTQKDVATVTTNNPLQPNLLTESLLSFGSIADEYSSIATSVFNRHNIGATPAPTFGVGDIGGGGGGGNGVGAGGGDNSTINESNNIELKPFRIEHETNQFLQQESGFEHMLQRNLSDLSRNPFQDNIAGGGLSDVGLSTMPSSQFLTSSMIRPLNSMRRMRVSKTEGRLEGPTEALLYSIVDLEPKMNAAPVDITVAEMCLSTLYFHELHKQNLQAKRFGSASDAIPGSSGPARAQSNTVVTAKAAESTPLLGNLRS